MVARLAAASTRPAMLLTLVEYILDRCSDPDDDVLKQWMGLQYIINIVVVHHRKYIVKRKQGHIAITLP